MLTRRGRGRGTWQTSTNQAAPETPDSMIVTDNPPDDSILEENIAGSEMESSDMNGVDMADNDVEIKDESQENETIVFDENATGQEGDEPKGAYVPPWRRLKVAGTRLKRKKVPGFKNTRIKKYAQPKNAVMCLNELDPGIAYITEQEGGISQPFCISVEINGQKYRGFGSSKQLAKQAAAEAALISYVKPPVATAENQEEDKTPWATLVSFAMYKMFNDWREGRVGMCPPQSQPYGTAIATGPMLAGINAFFSQPSTPATPAAAAATATATATATAATDETKPQAAAFVETINAHLGGRVPSDPAADPKNKAKALPKPAKQVPEGASTLHPVMVLNQMKPGVQYNVNESVRDGRIFFILKSDIDGQEFIGEGTNVKKAKLALAKAAIQELFGVESTFGS